MTSWEPETTQPRVLAVEARISEETPKDLRGVRTLKQALDSNLSLASATLAGRDGPFSKTPWEDDLAASQEVLKGVAEHVSGTLAAGERPVTLATDCSIALGTLPAVSSVAADAKVLWLDAHSDFDTPVTSKIGFLGCMSLAGACGRWDSGLGSIEPQRVVLCGARGKEGDFDIVGQRGAERSAMTMVAVSGDSAAQVSSALGDAPVYVHLDPDVLDPTVNPIWYGRDGGFTADALLELLRAVAARGPVLGLEVTAFHSDDDEEIRARVTELLVECTNTLLRVA